jgi:hypothetical protein
VFNPSILSKQADELTHQDLECLICGSPGSLTAPVLRHPSDEDFVVPQEYIDDPNKIIDYYLFLCRSQRNMLNVVMDATSKGERINTQFYFDRIDHVNFLVSEVRTQVIDKINKLVVRKPLTTTYWGLPVEYQAEDLPAVKDALVDLLTSETGIDDDAAKPPMGVAPQTIFLLGSDQVIASNGERDENLTWTSEAGTPLLFSDLEETSLLERARKLTEAYLRYTERGYNLPCSDESDHCSEIWLDELVEINLEMSERRASVRQKAVNQVNNIYALFPVMYSEQDIEQLNKVGLLNGN